MGQSRQSNSIPLRKTVSPNYTEFLNKLPHNLAQNQISRGDSDRYYPKCGVISHNVKHTIKEMVAASLTQSSVVVDLTTFLCKPLEFLGTECVSVMG